MNVTLCRKQASRSMAQTAIMIYSDQFVSGLTGPPDMTAVDETYRAFGEFHGLGEQHLLSILIETYSAIVHIK